MNLLEVLDVDLIDLEMDVASKEPVWEMRLRFLMA